MKILILIFAIITLSGCAVAMASKKKGVDVAEIMNCRIEACILALKDTQPLGTEKTATGKIVTYRSLQAQGSTGRAIMHGVLDVATLGVWEVAGTPIEGSKNNKQYYIYKVEYDKAGVVQKATIEAAS